MSSPKSTTEPGSSPVSELAASVNLLATQMNALAKELVATKLALAKAEAENQRLRKVTLSLSYEEFCAHIQDRDRVWNEYISNLKDRIDELEYESEDEDDSMPPPPSYQQSQHT